MDSQCGDLINNAKAEGEVELRRDRPPKAVNDLLSAHFPFRMEPSDKEIFTAYAALTKVTYLKV